MAQKIALIFYWLTVRRHVAQLVEHLSRDFGTQVRILICSVIISLIPLLFMLCQTWNWQVNSCQGKETGLFSEGEDHFREEECDSQTSSNTSAK